MSRLLHPPPTYHAATLSSLTNEDVPEEQTQFSSSYALRPKRTYPEARLTSNRGMNRQSTLVFADFNNFESPRGSRTGRRTGQDEESSEYDSSAPNSPSIEKHGIKSSATSTYSLDKKLPEPPYHVFSLAKKKQLVYIVSLAGLFSPLSSNIYFPALGQISKVSRLLYHHFSLD